LFLHDANEFWATGAKFLGWDVSALVKTVFPSEKDFVDMVVFPSSSAPFITLEVLLITERVLSGQRAIAF